MGSLQTWNEEFVLSKGNSFCIPHIVDPFFFTDATSEEFIPNVEKPVIVFMPEISKTHMGGTMRLGLRPTVFDSGTERTTARKLYAGAPTIWERHRHRYEVNPALVDELTVDGFKFVGKDEKGERMQILEFESELNTMRKLLQFVKKKNKHRKLF